MKKEREQSHTNAMHTRGCLDLILEPVFKVMLVGSFGLDSLSLKLVERCQERSQAQGLQN